MTRVLHTGDTHIGYRQYHSPERREDFLAAFRQVIEDAVTEDVDAVVHAGDLFHDRQPALADIHGTIEILRDLRDAGIPLYAVVGNHERTRGQQWLDLFETLSLATRLGREPRVVGDVALYGLDFVPRSRRAELDYEFGEHDAEHAALVAHGLFEPFAHADWETETVLREATVDFDAMLLGDNHRPGIETVDGTWVTYCGSTERIDATEREGRGYNLVTFDDEVTVARRGLETRPFVTVDLELAPAEGPDRVRERLREEDMDGAVVVVSIGGEGEPVAPAEVESFATEHGALVARVTDRREIESAEMSEVRFADPDQAVRERLREIGLSDAALGLDETIREQAEVADSNVRQVVTDHVRELLEEDPAAFEPTEPERAPPTTPTEGIDDGEAGAAEGASVEASNDDETERTGQRPPATAGALAGDGPSDDREGSTEEGNPRGTDPERQVTMEDYL